MNYNEKLQKSLRGLFLLDFREAITQQQFIIEKTGHVVIHHKDEKKKQRLNIKNLADCTSQAMEILSAMFDWSNGKIQEPEKKPDCFDGIVSNLTKQVQELDGKLDKLA